MAISKIGEFEKNNNISVNVLGVNERNVYVQRKLKYDDQKKAVNLLLIVDEKRRHYTMIKSLIRLLRINNSGINANIARFPFSRKQRYALFIL